MYTAFINHTYASATATTVYRSVCINYHRSNSTCLLKLQLGYCLAVYYSTEIRSVPDTCKQCRDPTNTRCLKKWSRCAKRCDRAAHGSVSTG